MGERLKPPVGEPSREFTYDTKEDSETDRVLGQIALGLSTPEWTRHEVDGKYDIMGKFIEVGDVVHIDGHNYLTRQNNGHLDMLPLCNAGTGIRTDFHRGWVMANFRRHPDVISLLLGGEDTP